MTKISHAFGGGNSGSVLDLPPDARVLARDFIATYDPRHYTPMPKKRPSELGLQHATKTAPNQNAVMIEQIQKLLKGATQQPKASFGQYSQARPLR